MANKRTRMLTFQARIDIADPAGSIQKHINDIESKGHYVMQYIPFGQFDGVILAHDYPDKKNRDDDNAPPSNPDGAPQAPVTDDLTTRGTEEIPPVEAPDLKAPESVKPNPLIESAKEMVKNKNKGKRR